MYKYINKCLDVDERELTRRKKVWGGRVKIREGKREERVDKSRPAARKDMYPLVQKQLS